MSIQKDSSAGLVLSVDGQAMCHPVCPRLCRCGIKSDPTHLLLICIINFFSGLWYDSSSCKFGWDRQQRLLATTGSKLLSLNIFYISTIAVRGSGAWHRSKWVNLDPRRAINVVEGPQSRTICLCLSSYFLQNIGISLLRHRYILTNFMIVLFSNDNIILV